MSVSSGGEGIEGGLMFYYRFIARFVNWYILIPSYLNEELPQVKVI